MTTWRDRPTDPETIHADAYDDGRVSGDPTDSFKIVVDSPVPDIERELFEMRRRASQYCCDKCKSIRYLGVRLAWSKDQVELLLTQHILDAYQAGYLSRGD